MNHALSAIRLAACRVFRSRRVEPAEKIDHAKWPKTAIYYDGGLAEGFVTTRETEVFDARDIFIFDASIDDDFGGRRGPDEQ